METKASYREKVSIRPECLLAHKDWVKPTSDEVRAALELAGWGGEAFARVIGVDGRTVRRWTLGEKEINYPAWCVLCVQAELGPIWRFTPL